jgi:hypothetical protein
MGKVILANNVTLHLLKQSFTVQDLSENRRKILKKKESEFVWIRAPAAILPAEYTNCMKSSAGCNTAGRT